MNDKKHRILLMIALALALAAAGCTFPGGTSSPTPFPDTAYTQAAQTIMAQLSQSAPISTKTPAPVPDTNTPVPATPTVEPPTPTNPASETPGATLSPTQPEQTTQPEPTAQLLFQDDFSRKTGWYVDEGEDFGFRYAGDAYEIYDNLRFAPIWSVRETDYGDIRIETDGAIVDGPQDGLYGVVCRHDGEDNYYALLISGDGSYGIGKSENGDFEFLEEGRAASDTIHSGNAFNRVRGDCVGDSLSLYANGQKLLEVQDSSFDTGYVGLIAMTRGTEGLVVQFDNFAILEP